MKYISGNCYTAADILLRRSAIEENLYKYKKESNIDNFVIAEIRCLRIELCLFEADSEENQVLNISYSNELE